MKRVEARMVAEELKSLMSEDGPYLNSVSAAKYLDVTPKFLLIHKEIPRITYYPLDPATGERAKKAMVRYRVKDLNGFLRGEFDAAHSK